LTPEETRVEHEGQRAEHAAVVVAGDEQGLRRDDLLQFLEGGRRARLGQLR